MGSADSLRGNVLRVWFKERAVGWAETWLRDAARRVGISSTGSSWRPGAHGVPQGRDQVSINIFISHLKEGTVSPHQFADGSSG